jgi:Cu+-exporting ATPase
VHPAARACKRNPRLISAELPVSQAHLKACRGRRQARAPPPMFAAVAGRLAGLLGVVDETKPGAADAVAQLKELGLEVWMVTWR